MELFPTLYGNERAKKRIADAITNRKLSHAYIIEGATGSGKRSFARLIAAALSCTQSTERLPCGECSFCRKILSDNAVDVHFLDKGETASVKAEDVRTLRSDMFLSATESDYKVYIIDDADTMTVQAQNALLIVLEEPPPNVLILLLCEESGKLLTTIRSRAQLIRMNLFTPSRIRQYLLSHEKSATYIERDDPEKFAAIVADSGGTIGMALAAMTGDMADKLLERRKKVDALLSALQKRRYGEIYDALLAFPQKRAPLCEYLQLVNIAVADLIRLKRNEDITLLFFPERDAAIEIAASIGIGRLFRIYDAIVASIEDLNKNANLSVVLSSLCGEIKSSN